MFDFEGIRTNYGQIFMGEANGAGTVLYNSSDLEGKIRYEGQLRSELVQKNYIKSPKIIINQIIKICTIQKSTWNKE